MSHIYSSNNTNLTVVSSDIPHGPHLPVLSPQALLVRLILYGILSVTAFFGNLLVLFVFYKKPSLRTKHNLFVINLAITDVINGIAKDVLIIIGMAPQRWIYSQALCDFSGFIIGLLHTATVETLMVIALFRYLCIVHDKASSLDKKAVLIALICVWLFSFLDGILPIMGWSHYQYSPYEFGCLPVWDLTPPSFVMYVLLTTTVIPFCVITICYTAVMLKILHNDHKIARQIGNSNGNGRRHLQNHLSRREIQAAWRMFVIYLAFIVCNVPYAVIVLILLPSHYHVPLDFLFAAGYLINLNSSINPIIYGMIYPEIRKGYKEVLCKSAVTSNTTVVISINSTGTSNKTKTAWN